MSVSAAGKQEDEESMVGFSFTSSKVKGSDQQLPKVWSKEERPAYVPEAIPKPKMKMPQLDEDDYESKSAKARLASRVDRTQQLATTLLAAVSGERQVVADAVAAAERKLGDNKREAVVAAGLAAGKVIEERLKSEHRQMLLSALEEASQAAQRAQEKAVAEAVAATEKRCLEEKRLAVKEAIVQRERELGHTEEEVSASAASMAFHSASSAASAALAATQAMQRDQQSDFQRRVQQVHTELGGENLIDEILPEGMRAQKEKNDDNLFFF